MRGCNTFTTSPTFLDTYYYYYFMHIQYQVGLAESTVTDIKQQNINVRQFGFYEVSIQILNSRTSPPRIDINDWVTRIRCDIFKR